MLKLSTWNLVRWLHFESYQCRSLAPLGGVIIFFSIGGQMKRLLLQAMFLLICMTIFSGCGSRKYELPEVVKSISDSGVEIHSEGTMFLMVGGKGCVRANWFLIDGYRTMVFEYDNVESAKIAKFEVRNAVRARNFLFAPPAYYTDPLPSSLVSSLNKALTIED
jgi:hypothetical protein